MNTFLLIVTLVKNRHILSVEQQKRGAFVTLNQLKVGQKGIITEISNESTLKQRFLDMGVAPQTAIECELESPWKNPKAYRVKEALIAIRDEDAEKIEVKNDE